MRNFADPIVMKRISDAIIDSVTVGKKIEDEIDGIRLVIDGKAKEAQNIQDYAAQLCWTHQVAAYGGIKKQRKYHNVVPEFKKQLGKQLKALGRLDLSEPQAVLNWLLDVRVAALCDWVWTKQVNDRVVRDLKEALPRTTHIPEGRELIQEALAILSTPDKELSREWVSAATRWIKRNK